MKNTSDRRQPGPTTRSRALPSTHVAKQLRMTKPPSPVEIQAALEAWQQECSEKAARAVNAISAYHYERTADAALASLDAGAGVLTLFRGMSVSQLEALTNRLRRPDEAQPAVPFWVTQTRQERVQEREALCEPMPDEFLEAHTRWARRERNREVMEELKRKRLAAEAKAKPPGKPTIKRKPQA